jgi:hypothetical protein
MRFIIDWAFSLFRKPDYEVAFIAFPEKTEKPKRQVKKATTRKPAVKKTVAKKATKVVKKAK